MSELNHHRGEAARLIRNHLWQGRVPPRSPDKRPWTMARDLNIWNRLVDAGYDPEELNEAIQVARTVHDSRSRDNWNGMRLKLTIFYWYNKERQIGATPFLEECLGYARKTRKDRDRDKGRLPPSIQSVLRDAIK